MSVFLPHVPREEVCIIMNRMEVIPAIIPDSYDHLKSKLALVRGVSNMVQIDLTDGVFVLNRSWPFHPSDKRQFQEIVRGNLGLPFWEEFNFEIDLMVQQPEKILGDWVKAGIARAVFHLESRHDFSEIKRVAGDAVELGVAVQNKTALSRLEPYIADVDYVQVMGIETIGKQGEAFSENTLETVRAIHEKFPNVTIQIDGGVDGEVAPRLKEAGVARLVSGSFILRAEDPKAAIETLKHV